MSKNKLILNPSNITKTIGDVVQINTINNLKSQVQQLNSNVNALSSQYNDMKKTSGNKNFWLRLQVLILILSNTLCGFAYVTARSNKKEIHIRKRKFAWPFGKK